MTVFLFANFAGLDNSRDKILMYVEYIMRHL